MLLYKSGLDKCIQSPEIETVKPFAFCKNTTYGLGGNAEAGYLPKTVYEAKKLYDNLTARGKEFKILGNGSNVLAADGGTQAEVISTKRMRGIFKLDNTRLLCLAGTQVCELLSYCKKHGLGGLEYLFGIPATVGGAAYMNAGVSGFAFGDNVHSVRVYDGKDRVLSRENCNFAYRHSTMRDINALILSIIVNVDQVPLSAIEERTEYFMRRRKHLPKGKSCGCVFKNPEGYSAGYLIDAAGLKGLRFGGAFVSFEHASFIINDGGSAGDVKRLIDIVKKKVFEKFGIILNEEVVYIGDFNDFNG